MNEALVDVLPKNVLTLESVLPIEAVAVGLLISRGTGRHIERVANCFVLLVVRTGTIHMEEDGKRFEVRAGEALLLWPGRFHRGTRDFDDDVQYFWLHFCVNGDQSRFFQDSLTDDEEYEGRQFEEATNLSQGISTVPVPQHTKITRPEVVTELFRRFMDDNDSGYATPLAKSLYTSMILNEIASAPLQTDPGAASILAGNALTYIRLHFHEKITASDVANALGYSVQYLGRVYQRTYNSSVSHAIRRARVNHAKLLLLHSNYSIAEVGRQCGFDDDAYFLRVFKQLEGITPLRFRKMHSRMTVNTH